MKFLNGFKTIIGLAGVVVSTVVPSLVPVVNEIAPQLVGIAQGVFGVLATLGVVHKVEKINEEKANQFKRGGVK